MPGLCCFKKRLKIGLCGGGDHTVFERSDQSSNYHAICGDDDHGIYKIILDTDW
jgi:hypothetical protein